jgi:phosphoglycerate dehydrogenase-like enzyme
VNPDVLNAKTKIKAILRDWIKYDSADCAGVRKRGIPACDIPARIEMETIRALAVPVVTSA